MSEVTLKELLESGAHFGHQTSRWNPKMKPYILTAKNGVHLVNLKETIECIKAAEKLTASVVANGGSVLFVGTKAQAKDVVRESAEECRHYYINTRWLGGMLTNFATVRKSIKRVEEIDRMESDGTFKVLPKKEVNILKKKREKILAVLSGVREMKELPGLMVVIDIIKEKIAIDEAKRLNIPVIALVDTNGDPTTVTCPIPANDDSLKTISIVLKSLAKVVLSTPVTAVKRDPKGEGSDGRKRIVKRTVVKKIIKKKVLKSTGATVSETSEAVETAAE
ncbi:MAG: 30S ribosomal protein S2 [Fibrobacteres bacterium]|nr:30S ribosomal protein S2 [Fibrobacterota bacterium]